MQQKILNGRYELEQKVGEGGMARVYRGRDLRLSRRVAVKVLHTHYADDTNFIERFHHEAQAAANLHHPNIVDVYDVGQDRDIHYIVMEYLQGSDLKSAILRSGALPVEQVIAVGAAVADGLDAAHRMGMVHRDVKPQNIILGDDGQVKITDFGIAKSSLSTATTETGVTFGTADYLSPEQASGLPATAQSDIYALGVTLYEALTGRLPFTGETSVAVALKHVGEEPLPPRAINPRIPIQIEALVLRAMAKSPEQRPASARDLAQMLRGQRALSEQDTIMRPAARPAPGARPGPARPAQPRPAPPAATAPRPVLPPPRSPVPAPIPSSGAGLGTFLIGLLVLGMILTGIYLFATGAFDGLLGGVAGPSVRPTRPPIGSADPTATLEPGEPTPTAAPEITMPNLVGLDVTQARDALAQLSLFAQEAAPRYSDVISAGLVLDQAPPPGQLVDATTTISFTVSLGPEAVEIPNVVGLRVINARIQLEQLGFKVAIVEESSSSVSEGFVIRTEPSVGVRPQRGETVTLVYSIGNKTLMPEVTGLPIEEARRRIEAAGLFISFEDLQSCDRLPADVCASSVPGQVVSSEPRGGQRVERGTGVTLGVRAP